MIRVQDMTVDHLFCILSKDLWLNLGVSLNMCIYENNILQWLIDEDIQIDGSNWKQHELDCLNR